MRKMCKYIWGNKKDNENHMIGKLWRGKEVSEWVNEWETRHTTTQKKIKRKGSLHSRTKEIKGFKKGIHEKYFIF